MINASYLSWPSGLELSPKDPKALFRRAQAYEAEELYEKAYADARALQVVDPKNKEVQTMLERLHKIIQDKVSGMGWLWWWWW